RGHGGFRGARPQGTATPRRAHCRIEEGEEIVSTHLLLEAAVRSLVMGAIIFVALRLMRIEHVRARRTAWLLALAGALAMPVLVSAQIGPRLLPEFASVTSHLQFAAPSA